jgi:mono/diheme cytochrome c family protein
MPGMEHMAPKAFPSARVAAIGLAWFVLIVSLGIQARPSAQQPASQVKSAQSSSPIGAVSPASSHRGMLDRYCVTCHNQRLATAGLKLDEADVANPGEGAEIWEKVVRKLRTGMMPPPNVPQPSMDDRRALLSWLETSLDKAAAAKPNPGRTETLRRLNRTEYQNAIRDLLSVDIDAASLLPADESGHGFDNVTVGDLPPALLDRYISAAQKISALAIGSTQTSLQSDIIRVPPDVTQEGQVAGLPVGTRGGVLIPYTFAQDGEYDIQIYLARGYSGDIDGLKDPQPHEIKLLLDRTPIGEFTVQRPANGDDALIDRNLKIRVPVTAGPHQVGVTFLKNSSSLIETARQPLQSRFNERRHPRMTPAISQVSVTGPYEPQGADNTPSRRRIFVCRPAFAKGSGEAGSAFAKGSGGTGLSTDEETACARRILSTLTRRAYRRSISEADLERPMAFYREGKSERDFDAGIGKALSAVLINPEFLFRVEVDPDKTAAGAAYRISDLELASRLSFFLWSSLPDDALLDSAIRGELRRPAVLDRHVRRMLADPRSYNLASNFAGQWLRLRNVTSVDPNVRLYPDFDDNLRQAFRLETELFVDSVVREDRSVLDLLRADYTFLNERLAKHYGIPNVYGSRFRRVELGRDSRRGGLLRQGSILAVSSYATRTSPVLRGVWVLSNIVGAPPPPPLPNVPALDGNVPANLPVRERMAAHRASPVCASCHRTIDPVGFTLENFDAVGRWRENEGDSGPIDVSGTLPGLGDVNGVAGLEEALLRRPELFAATLTEKLLTFALGRGVEYYDAPAVRKILREAQPGGYHFSSLILGIVNSAPFQMRRSS